MTAPVEIVGAVWGGQDCTAFVRSMISQISIDKPALKTASFVPTISLLGDPVPYFVKACVVVWRNTFTDSNGKVQMSQLKSTVGHERYPVDDHTVGSPVTVTWDGVGDTAWIPPIPTDRGQFVVSAYWFDLDKTQQASKELSKYENSRYPGTLTFEVNTTTMGEDPKPQTSKQFALVYGNWDQPGQWSFHVACGFGATDWNLVIPPNTLNVINRVTLKNDGNVNPVYPVVIDENFDQVFVGDKDFVLTNGQTRTLDLVTQAGCSERQSVWINYMDSIAKQDYQTMPSLPFIASSSTSATPCQYKIGQGPIMITKTYNSQVAPVDSNKDLRVNVYSATWGGDIYTEFIRQQYISSTIYNPPTDSVNSWTFPASDPSFGTDPNHYVRKCFVVIYRIARVIGLTNGAIFASNQMDPTATTYNAEAMNSVNTDKYPVLEDISDFRIATMREYNGTLDPKVIGMLQIDLISQAANITPWTMPTTSNNIEGYNYLAVKAIWGDKDVTSNMKSAVVPRLISGMIHVSVGTQSFGDDPWFGVPKQCTVLIAYPKVLNDPTSWEFRTYVHLDVPNPWGLNIDPTIQPISKYPEWPQGFIADTGPSVQTVQFINNTDLTMWPRIAIDQARVYWDGFLVANSANWTMPPSSTKILNLCTDAHCMANNLYAPTLGFGNSPNPQPYTPFSGWIKAGTPNTAGPAFSMKMTYMNDGVAGAAKRYKLLREFALIPAAA